MDIRKGLQGLRILITGANGFLGRHVVRQLSSWGIPCTATSLQKHSTSSHAIVKWISMDLRNAEEVRSVVRLSQPRIVVHLAAAVSSGRTPIDVENTMGVNVLGTHNLLRSLMDEAPELVRVVVLGTGEEYGNSDRLPLTEEHPLQPVSPYSASKAAANQFVFLYQKLFSLPCVILRPFVIYGPDQAPTMMIPELITSALSGKEFRMTKGEQTRDFVYVDDVIDCLWRAAMIDAAAGNIFNVCTGREHTLREVAERVLALTQSSSQLLLGALPYRQNEVWRSYGSYEKARRVLHWEPATDLDTGLRKTIEWYQHMRLVAAS